MLLSCHVHTIRDLSAFAAILTGHGPFQNLKDHLANPTGANILTNFGFGN